jgi:uncharacterized membrane protein
VFAYALSTGVALSCGFVALLLTLEAARRSRWRASTGEHLRWALATAFVLLGHRMAVHLDSGLELHYLGSAFLALVLGYPRALVSMALVLAVECAFPAGGPALDPEVLATWGLRVLLGAALPVWAMWAIVMACKRWLPRNLFVFLLGCGLFGLFFSYALQLAGTALAFTVLAPSIPRGFGDDFVPYALLLASGESWLEGMLTTVLVVYVPGSVQLFDEAFYLKRRG